MDVEAFIERWTQGEGGAERANYQSFLLELCDVIGVARPDPAGATPTRNDYVFERAVRPRKSAPGVAPKRIDLYKKDAFILEAKQSRQRQGDSAVQPSLLPDDRAPLGRRDGARGWDAMMQNARRQAEDYVFLLPADHPAPPFLIACDVGNCLELYADFTGTGRAYDQFPDRRGYRVFMEDLGRPETRQLLADIWTDPFALDPARTSARVTREIAARLAQVSKALEKTGTDAEAVAHFLMRCLFTMFAEDTQLLPTDSFKTLLEKCVADPSHFALRVKALWSDMEAGNAFSHVIEARVRHFNGGLFKDAIGFDLGQKEIGELLAAAKADWKLVDPAIFGTLLEQALDPVERKKLGAHYTPRAYVQRLVDVTVMEPLRADWQIALTKAETAREDGDPADAVAAVRGFHLQLCATRVLDPACGTGNFLYVALEVMKRLEGEVLQALADLGETQGGLAMAGESVGPHQFLGLEMNPRAAAIAELVVWIGYLQWHYRNNEGHPNEPILRAFKNINFGRREGYDAVLTWDGCPLPALSLQGDKRVETYPNLRRPAWPEAEFIVGNPPFTGGKDIRSAHGDGYAEALWKAHPAMNDSADLVMYWWDRAADILTRKGSKLRRFGLVTTNSIAQVFQRRTVARWLSAGNPNKQALSLVFAVDDHPWTKMTKDAAAVRIAMTVARAGAHQGALLTVTGEAGLDTDEPKIDLAVARGVINADLTVGVDVTRAGPLMTNDILCSPGVKLHGTGFIVSPAEAEHLGLGRLDRPGLGEHIRAYRNGRDLLRYSRGMMVIDLDGMSAVEVRSRYPEIYQHLLISVKPERDRNNEAYRRENWWLFGRRNTIMRGAIEGIPRYIATSETAKHRIFEFLDPSILPDNRLVCFGLSGGEFLAILSSRVHVTWTLASGGTLEDRPIYTKTRCFDPFPFPAWTEAARVALAAAGERLDAFRKSRLAENPDLTLTRLYNALEAHRAGRPMSAQEAADFARGSVTVLSELHGEIDVATLAAYGWPADLAGEALLAAVVALNAERAAEEAAGKFRWLRPDYQIPRIAKGAAARTGDLALLQTVVAIDQGRRAFPASRLEQPLAVEAALSAARRAMTAAELARGFKKGGRKIEGRIVQTLATLTRYGRVVDAGDGRFAARRVA